MPAFATEAEERAFWAEHDSVEYFDWTRAERVQLPNLKPSTRTISLRLPAGLLDELKMLANQRDILYQSLLKVFLAERVADERARTGNRVALPRPEVRSRGSTPDVE